MWHIYRIANRKNNLVIFLRNLEQRAPIKRDRLLAQHALSLSRPEVADRSIAEAKIRPLTRAEWLRDKALFRASAEKTERLRDQHEEYSPAWWRLECVRERIVKILCFLMEFGPTHLIAIVYPGLGASTSQVEEVYIPLKHWVDG